MSTDKKSIPFRPALSDLCQEATFGSLATIMRGRGFLEKRTSHPIIYTLFAKRGRIMVNYHVDNILYLAREQQLYRWSLSGVA